MKLKFFATAMLAATLLFTLTACGKTQSPSASDKLDSATQETEQQTDVKTPANEDSSTSEDDGSEDEAAPTGKDGASEDEVAPTNKDDGSGDEAAPTGEDEASEEEPWKSELAEDLFETYGVLPEYYEDQGDGIYLVYVEVGGEVIPFVTVDSATGEYHQ